MAVTIHNGAHGTAVLAKALAMLRRISTRHRTGWRLTELARACGYDHATVHRILGFLAREGMVARRPGTRRYVLGPLAQELGLAVHPAYDLRAGALDGLARLARFTGGTAFLNLRSGDDSVCAARADGRLRMRALAVEVGTRRPLCLSAGGVAILLRLPPRERARAMRYGLAEARRIGEGRVRAVETMIRMSLRAGIGINSDGIIPGITALGVAVSGADGMPVAALSVAVYSDRLEQRMRQAVIGALRREAALLESPIDTARRSPEAAGEPL